MKGEAMKPFILMALSGILALTSCGGAPSSDAGGSRPTARVTSLFEFPEIATGAKTYLQFRDPAGKSVKQEELKAGETSRVIEIQNLGTPLEADLSAPLSFKPADATVVQGPTPSSAKIYGLAPVIYADRNSNGTLDDGELLLMTHDRVLYSSAAFTAAYSQAVGGKTMTTRVNAQTGWTRLEHYVYLPRDSSEYKRSLTSTVDRTFYLHKVTPETSM